MVYPLLRRGSQPRHGGKMTQEKFDELQQFILERLAKELIVRTEFYGNPGYTVRIQVLGLNETGQLIRLSYEHPEILTDAHAKINCEIESWDDPRNGVKSVLRHWRSWQEWWLIKKSASSYRHSGYSNDHPNALLVHSLRCLTQYGILLGYMQH